jgi:hypothetical protein
MAVLLHDEEGGGGGCGRHPKQHQILRRMSSQDSSAAEQLSQQQRQQQQQSQHLSSQSLTQSLTQSLHMPRSSLHSQSLHSSQHNPQHLPPAQGGGGAVALCSRRDRQVTLVLLVCLTLTGLTYNVTITKQQDHHPRPAPLPWMAGPEEQEQAQLSLYDHSSSSSSSSSGGGGGIAPAGAVEVAASGDSLYNSSSSSSSSSSSNNDEKEEEHYEDLFDNDHDVNGDKDEEEGDAGREGEQEPSESASTAQPSQSPVAFHLCTENVGYHCEGEAYDRFADAMDQYIRQQQQPHANNTNNTSSSTSSSSQSNGGGNSSRSMWGRRPFPLPSNSRVLAVGNSHTRQTLSALTCAYSDQIVAQDDLAAGAASFTFANGASLVVITNSPYVYSHQWDVLLVRANLLPAPVLDGKNYYDAVILGKFNNYSPTDPSTFGRDMLAFSKQQQEGSNITVGKGGSKASDAVVLDYQHIKGPMPEDVAHKFSGAILGVSMFAKYGQWEVQESTERAIAYWNGSSSSTGRKGKRARKKNARPEGPRRDRHNIVYLSGRHHIPALGECGWDSWNTVGVCLMEGDESPFGRVPVDMHRCTGARGGHPDLLAWDIIEELYRLIGDKTGAGSGSSSSSNAAAAAAAAAAEETKDD